MITQNLKKVKNLKKSLKLKKKKKLCHGMPISAIHLLTTGFHNPRKRVFLIVTIKHTDEHYDSMSESALSAIRRPV